MGQVQQRVLTFGLAVVLAIPGVAKRFYPDDPIAQMPPSLPVEKAEKRDLSEYYDFFHHTFAKPGEKHKDADEPIQAKGVNTIGEAPDSDWFTNRHGLKRMNAEELARGPGNSKAPSDEGPWTVVAAKSEGITPGLTITDSSGRRYLLKFDPREYPEVASGADAIGSRFFHAIGYFTPQNYIVRLERERLRVDPKARMVDYRGLKRPMREKDIDLLLERVEKGRDGKYRALASLFVEGKPLEAFRYYGVRTDDPNDIYPHEHRRDLRGLFVFASWLNHTDAKSINSLDTLIEEGGRKFIRHWLLDFGAILGSDSFTAKSPRSGNVHLFEWPAAARQFFSLGLYTPGWMRSDYRHVDSIGRIESEEFDPERWKPNYYNPAFANMLPDDAFWAAKIVHSFRDEDIRALVKTGEYSDKAGEEHLVQMLIARRNKITRAWFSRVLPLANFRVERGMLAFDDLGAARGSYVIRWAGFDNESERKTGAAAEGPAVPVSPTGYAVADVHAGDPAKTVSVYVSGSGRDAKVVGVERKW